MTTRKTSHFLSRLRIKSLILQCSVQRLQGLQDDLMPIISFHGHTNHERNIGTQDGSFYLHFTYSSIHIVVFLRLSINSLCAHQVSNTVMSNGNIQMSNKSQAWSLDSLMGKMGIQTDKVQYRCCGQNSWDVFRMQSEGILHGVWISWKTFIRDDACSVWGDKSFSLGS